MESHRLTLTTRYQVDYIETLYGLVRSRLAVAILPALYTTHLQDPALKIAQLRAAGADPYGGPDARPAGAAAAYRSLFFPAAGRIALGQVLDQHVCG